MSNDVNLYDLKALKAFNKTLDLQKQINGLSISPKGAYATAADLATAFPTGNDNIYIVSADGNWYFWNGTAWTPGGLYQTTDANLIKVADANEKFTGEDVETVLEEIKDELDELKSDYTSQVQTFEAQINTLDSKVGAVFVNNSTELNSAISNGKNVIVIKKNADISVSSTIMIPEGTMLIGYGAKLTRAVGFQGAMLRLAANCHVVGLKINGNRTAMINPTWDTTTEIRVALGKCVIDDVTIEDGNEAIVVYGDDVVVRGCKITNCGGNGIHFSGANRTRVENCTIIGTNKVIGMGHEDGCIIWSDACNYAICQSNWVEDGVSGFGSIDWENNDNVKIIANTMKDCRTSAIDITSAVKAPKNIIIANNHIINCKKLIAANYQSDKVKSNSITINSNILEDTALDARWVEKLNVVGNTFKNGYVVAINCDNAVISNNTIEMITGIGIYIENSRMVTVSSNNIKCLIYGVYASGSEGSVINANTIRQSPHSNHPNEPAIKINTNLSVTITNNVIYLYFGLGLYLFSNVMCTGNKIIAANPLDTAILLWNGNTGYIVANNASNAVYNIASVASAVVENNITLSDSSFQTVTATLTNITSNGGSKCLIYDDYVCTLTAEAGYTLPATITVVMGGTTLTSGTDYTYNASTGALSVTKVTGALTITATA